MSKIQNKFESPLRNIDAGEQRKYSSYPFRVSIFLSGFWVLPVNATLSSIIFTLVFTVFFSSFFRVFIVYSSEFTSFCTRRADAILPCLFRE